jgi:hypothetical protein
MRSLLLALLTALTLAAADGDAYRQALQAMQGHANRQPGSPGYAAAVDGVEAALRGAGLAVERLRYRTLATSTDEIRLEADGVEIPGVLAMAPNGAVPSTTWGGEVAGPLVWLGEGSLEEMRGRPVEGAIALLRLGSPNLPLVFSQGAKAVIAIDDGSADQWQASRMFTEGMVSSPRAYLPRSVAEAHGLLAGAPRQGRLRIASSWRDVEATTLWSLIPGRSRSGQVVVLAAELATSGAVPAQAPGGRQAANAALLAELAASLAADPPERSVLVVFLGSHYAAQDGARHLYWAINKAQQALKERETLAARAGWIGEQIAVCERRIGLLGSDEVLQAGGDDAFQLRNQLRRIVTGRMNQLNYRYRDANLRLAEAAKGSEEEEARAADQLRLKAEIAAANADRRTVFEGVVSDREAFAAIRRIAIAEVEALRDDLRHEAQRTADAERLRAALDGKAVIAHFGIDFADPQRPWLANPFGLSCKAVYGQDWARRPQPGHFAKHIATYQQAWDAIAPNLAGYAALRNPDQTVAWSFEALSTPRRRQVACVVPQGLGIMGSQLVSIGDALPRDEMPHDPPPDLLALRRPLAAWLARLLGGEIPVRTGLAATQSANDRLVWGRNGSLWTGIRVDRLAPGSEEVEGPAAGALVYIRPGRIAAEDADEAQVCGRINSALGRVDAIGCTVMPNIITENLRTQLYAIELGAGGAPKAFFNAGSSGNENNLRLFTGWGNGVYVPFMPADYLSASPWQRLLGRSDSTVKRSFGDAGIGGAVIVTDEKRPLKLIGNGLLVLGASAQRPQGSGIACDAPSLLSLDLIRRSAEDVSQLNRHRLGVLRAKNLINRPVERVNAACNAHLTRATAARQGGDVRAAAAHETMAAVLAHRAQVPLRENTNDLLQAVVFLLLLAIPFAFVLERLLLGAVSIYRQIGGFLALFLATFGLLYATHPAFALADAPIIIFLAFVIILLSAFVISVVMGKFRHELKAMQGLAAKSHATGTGNSTTMAAIIIGIAGMRNRPLKTFLTTITVTLLTFTILVFASFGSGYGVVETWLGKSQGADRIELHQKSFLAIPDRLVDAIQEVHGRRCEVLRRTASFADPMGRSQESPLINLVLEPASGATLKLDALLGIDPAEAPRLGFFPGLARPAPGQPAQLWLSTVAAGQLKVQAGARLLLRGREFTCAGTFDEQRFKALENLDGSRLTPPDFTATFANAPVGGTDLLNAVENLDITSFIFSSPALTAVTSDEVVLELGGMTNGLTLYPRDGRVDLARHAGEIAAVFNAPVQCSSGEGTRSFWYTREVSGSGYGDLIVPLLLGGLIIFSSLLGSIVDRQKEIFTYSALGLSPRDVGTLFFAESAVIAVVGGMGGYLTGQLVAKGLNLLAEHGLVAIPPLNFSSLASLATIGIVMLMVLLSTIYPALMAGRSANPGVNRSWRMPEPEGDVLRFTFPFTVPENAFGGIVAFISEHFRNHGDAALDVFAAQDVRLFKADGSRIGIRADISLAPFDLGVFQRFSMSTRASDTPGIDEVVVEIVRTSGAPRTWMRGNRGFIADLRAQFLLWRSLPEEAVAHYRAEAARLLDGGDDATG